MVTMQAFPLDGESREGKRRRRLAPLAILVYTFGLLFLAAAARAEIVLQDAAGREVRLAAPARRIVANDSLLLYSLALIDPDPVSKIAGWAGRMRIDSGVYAAFRARFPEIEAVPELGGVVPSNASLEAIMSADPDLFVVSLWEPGWDAIAHQLEEMGVPVVFLDSPHTSKLTAPDATAFSIGLLGKAIGREEEAQVYADFVKSKFAKVADRLATLKERPSVLIDVHAGMLCCYTPGSGNRITEYLALAGGQSIGADVISGYDGRLSSEFVLGVEPDLYVATGSPHLLLQGGFVIGGGISPEAAVASLGEVTSHNLLGNLLAVKERRAFGISHQLAITPLNVLAFECFAKWTHPDELGDIDPDKTLAEINERFLPVRLEGTFWTGLGHAATVRSP